MRLRLSYVAERRLFGVFTGNVGAGKTTIVRWLVEELSWTKLPIALLAICSGEPRALASADPVLDS